MVAIAVRDGRVALLLQDNFAATDVGRTGERTLRHFHIHHHCAEANSARSRPSLSPYSTGHPDLVTAASAGDVSWHHTCGRRGESTAVLEPLEQRGDHPDERPTDWPRVRANPSLPSVPRHPVQARGDFRPVVAASSLDAVQGRSSSCLARLGSTRHRSSLPESASPSATLRVAWTLAHAQTPSLDFRTVRADYCFHPSTASQADDCVGDDSVVLVERCGPGRYGNCRPTAARVNDVKVRACGE